MVAFPPTIPDIAADSEGRKGEIKNTGIQRFSRSFAELLGSFCTDRALSIYPGNGKQQTKNCKYSYHPQFFHEIDFEQSYDDLNE